VFTISKFGFGHGLIGADTLIIEDTRTGGEKLREYFNKNHIKNNFYILDDNPIKKNYENRIGIGYSVVGALISNGILLAGKNVLIVGYGPVGQGLARFCKGIGAKVTIADINSEALKTASTNYYVGPLSKVIKDSDIVITATGKNNVLNEKTLTLARDGIILANAGADFGEWNQDFLRNNSTEIVKIHESLTLYVLRTNKRIFELGGGNSINLVCGVSVSEFLDLTFSLGILIISQYLSKGSETQEIIFENISLNKLNKAAQYYE
jgi:adenosylhomocysteinase